MPDAPLLLAFDTSAAHCAAALLSGDRLLGVHFEERQRGQAENLFPALDDLLRQSSVSYAHLAGIGVGTGPGNFTGLRISVSAARGLALGLGVPAIGVSAFETAAALAPAAPDEILLAAPRGAAYRVAWCDDSADGPPALVSDVAEADLAVIDWSGPGIAALARRAMAKLISGHQQPRPAPLYVRPADAAPARDRAPAILP